MGRVDAASGLLAAGVKAVISFSIRRSLSSIRSMASGSGGGATLGIAAEDVAFALVVVGIPIARFLRSELLTHSTPAEAQNPHGLPPSHFVLRRRQVSQADPELRRRAVLVVKTERGTSETTLYTQSMCDSTH